MLDGSPTYPSLMRGLQREGHLEGIKEAKPRIDTETSGCVWGVLKSCGSTGPLCLSAEKNSGRGTEMDKK